MKLVRVLILFPLTLLTTVSVVKGTVAGGEWPNKSKHIHKPGTLGFDKIYVVNLKRRHERREQIEEAAKEHKLDLSFFYAVDGSQLDNETIKKRGIKILPGYLGPKYNKNITLGEIGCVLSHYSIWADIVMNRFKTALVLEDDATFMPGFRENLSKMYADVKKFVPDWDLIYLGKYPWNEDAEEKVNGTDNLTWPHYSYWAVAYALSNKGAKKMLQQKPLTKLVPVDEYINIMFDKHPNNDWKQHFKPRDLVAVSTDPLLIEPDWFSNDEVECISDTEFSPLYKVSDD